jgi:hypothetical protein
MIYFLSVVLLSTLGVFGFVRTYAPYGSDRKNVPWYTCTAWHTCTSRRAVHSLTCTFVRSADSSPTLEQERRRGHVNQQKRHVQRVVVRCKRDVQCVVVRCERGVQCVVVRCKRDVQRAVVRCKPMCSVLLPGANEMCSVVL